MENITLVKEAIHRPEEPRHFMELQHPEGHYTAVIGGEVIADTRRAMKLAEVGYHIYEPVIYFPLDDVNMGLLRRTDKSTHCPLKGDTAYFDYVGEGGALKDVGWSYAEPLDFAADLANYIAFDRNIVTVTADRSVSGN
jgi:uncharacterized protein (DUF427 family)